MSEKNKKGIVSRFRPDGWDALIPGLVEECIKAGEIEAEGKEDRARIESFIRYCLGVGADAMLEGIRVYGVDALVKQGKILAVLSALAVPGRPQYRDMGMSYRDKAGYAGPGKIAFIPADKEIFKLPPGTISGGGNGGKKK